MANILGPSGQRHRLHRMTKDTMRRSLFSLIFLPVSLFGFDVVIPAVTKDQATLDLAISCIRSHLAADLGNIYVISPTQITDRADWVPEERFPFQLEDVRHILAERTKVNRSIVADRAGWYLQQLLKLYAGKVIPNLSSDYLVVDADTLIYKHIRFYRDGLPCYATSTERHEPYFTHMARLLPGLMKLERPSGIVHHMLFQQPVLERLFGEVEAVWGCPFWEAFLLAVDPKQAFSGASEYEIYFNYLTLRHIPRVIRDLRWKNESHLRYWPLDASLAWDFVSYHAYARAP
jgi:hypothetical protein